MGILNWVQTNSNSLMVFILFLTAIGTWLSARSAKKAAVETRNATQASLIAKIMDDYSAPEMIDALHLLDRFKTDHGSDYAYEFRNLRKNNYDSIRQIDHARRRVSHFYSKIYVLKKLKYINDEAVKEIATKGQVKYFRHVVEPLEAVINQDYDRSAFESLGQLYNIEPGHLPMAKPK